MSLARRGVIHLAENTRIVEGEEKADGLTVWLTHPTLSLFAEPLQA